MRGAVIVWRIAGCVTIFYIVMIVFLSAMVYRSGDLPPSKWFFFSRVEWHFPAHIRVEFLPPSQWVASWVELQVPVHVRLPLLRLENPGLVGLWFCALILAMAPGPFAFFRLSAGKSARVLLAAYATATILLILAVVGIPAYHLALEPFRFIYANEKSYTSVSSSGDFILIAIFAGVLSVPVAMLSVLLAMAAAVRLKKVGRVVGLVLAGLIVGGLVLHTGLNVYAGRKIKEEIRRIEERGEPVRLDELLDELVGAPVPEDQNAAPLYEEIVSLLQTSELRRAFGLERGKEQPWMGDYSDWSEEERKEMPAILAKDDGIFDLLHKASLRPYCRWDRSVTAGFLGVQDPWSVLWLVELLSMKSALEKETGHIEKAIESICDGFAAARAAERHSPVRWYWFRRACDDIMLDRLERLLTDREISWESCQKLYDVLRKERETSVINLYGDRYGLIRDAEDEAYAKERSYLLRPFLRLLHANLIRSHADIIEYAGRPYWEIKEVLPAPYVRLEGERAKTSARLAASELGIALRMYKSKMGRYPGSLDTLVPAIVEELPLDPLTGDRFLYRQTERGFIVHNVTEDIVWRCDE